MCFVRGCSTIDLRDFASQAGSPWELPSADPPKHRLPPRICIAEDLNREDEDELQEEEGEGFTGQRLSQYLSPMSASSLCHSHGISDATSLNNSFVSGVRNSSFEICNGSFALAIGDLDTDHDINDQPLQDEERGGGEATRAVAEAEEEEEDWVVVTPDCLSNAHASDEALECWAHGALAPADVAANLMGLIYQKAKRPSFTSTQFEAYHQELFDKLKGPTPWDPHSLLSPLHAIDTSSRSGSWLFQTDDKHLVLKRVRAYEKDKLVQMAADYVVHLLAPFHSLLCPVYGCYRYVHRSTNLYFVLMGTCHPPGTTLRTLYDLKGSTAGRTASPPPRVASPLALVGGDGFLRQPMPVPGAALKDNDLKQPIQLLSAETWDSLRATLYRDSQFLAQNDIFDYSLLVAEADGLEDLCTPENPSESGCDGMQDCVICPLAHSQGAALDTPRAGKLESLLKSVLFRFHQMPAESAVPVPRMHRPWPCAQRRVAFLGIIDFMTPWSVVNIGDGEGITIPKGRSLEYFLKRRFKPGCSIMPPAQYQQRFVEQVMRKFVSPTHTPTSSATLPETSSPPPALMLPSALQQAALPRTRRGVDGEHHDTCTATPKSAQSPSSVRRTRPATILPCASDV